MAIVDGVGHGDRYRFRLDDGEPLADPASGWQPDGVHGPSAVVDAGRFDWSDEGWRGVALADTVLYELHVGTFTPEGTLDAAIGQLDRLARLGVTAVELMPVNAFPGHRNWGYDGVFPSAVQHSYGGPEALARFVDAAHGRGLAVVLDVVYNHLGPEGAVLSRYGPYFTATHRTPWGDGLNVAEAGSDDVRRTFIESAVRWITDFHVDGLRLDAIDQIFDPTAVPFLEQLIDAVHGAGAAAGRTVLTFVESAANNPDHVRPAARRRLRLRCGVERRRPPRPAGRPDRRPPRLLRRLRRRGRPRPRARHRWVFTGRYSTFRGRHHGRPADDVDAERFVVFSSNHDHVGNTPAGARPPFDSGAPARRRRHRAAVAIHAAAVHGRGVRRDRARSRTSSTTATRTCSRRSATVAGRSSPASSGPRRWPTPPTRRRSPAPCSTRRSPATSRTARSSPPTPSCWRCAAGTASSTTRGPNRSSSATAT